MDWLFPGSLDLSRVQFQCDTIMHSLHNFTLLQAAFRKAGVIRVSVAALSCPDIEASARCTPVLETAG